jgi:hypothetical protein
MLPQCGVTKEDVKLSTEAQQTVCKAIFMLAQELAVGVDLPNTAGQRTGRRVLKKARAFSRRFSWKTLTSSALS